MPSRDRRAEDLELELRAAVGRMVLVAIAGLVGAALGTAFGALLLSGMELMAPPLGPREQLNTLAILGVIGLALGLLLGSALVAEDD